MKGLLIVDLQNDFLPKGSLAIASGDEIIPFINELMNQFECVVATKDFHPKNHISFASRHHKRPGEKVTVEGREQELWPDHCIQESIGSDFPLAFHQEKVEKVFYKGIDPDMDSYSGFFDERHLRSTGLEEYLKKRGVTELFIVGLALDYCVKWTSLDAIRSGFEVTILLGGCRGIGESQALLEAISDMKKAGIRFID